MENDTAIWLILLYLLGAYLIGAIPSAYILARLLKGIDIREYGSGNVGGNNAAAALGLWALFVIGIFDLGKGALVTWLAFVPLDLGYAVAFAAGLCAAIGHNWSIFLGFSGGRGLATSVGALLVLFPWGALYFLLCTFAGWRLKSTAGSTVGLLGLPVLSLILNMPPAVTWGTLGMKLSFHNELGQGSDHDIRARLREANRQPLPAGPERWGVVWRRLWLDRDLADHAEWLARRPPDQ